jgi:hypothetical protein
MNWHQRQLKHPFIGVSGQRFCFNGHREAPMWPLSASSETIPHSWNNRTLIDGSAFVKVTIMANERDNDHLLMKEQYRGFFCLYMVTTLLHLSQKSFCASMRYSPLAWADMLLPGKPKYGRCAPGSRVAV